jgi:hypothetical protein
MLAVGPLKSRKTMPSSNENLRVLPMEGALSASALNWPVISSSVMMIFLLKKLFEFISRAAKGLFWVKFRSENAHLALLNSAFRASFDPK